jgi:hypothetical protein
MKEAQQKPRPLEWRECVGCWKSELISGVEEVSDSGQRCAVEHRIDPNTRTAPHIITESEIQVYFVGKLNLC